MGKDRRSRFRLVLLSGALVFPLLGQRLFVEAIMRWLIAILSGFALLFQTDLASNQPQPKKKRDPNVADTPPLTPEQQLEDVPSAAGIYHRARGRGAQGAQAYQYRLRRQGPVVGHCSQEYPFPAPAGSKSKDAVRILEDFDATGLARKVSTFADGLNIPIGVLPTDQGAIVYSIPNIYHLIDSDGKGMASRRDVLYSANTASKIRTA